MHLDFRGKSSSNWNASRDESVETGDESVETRDESIEAGEKKHNNHVIILPEGARWFPLSVKSKINEYLN